MRISFAAFFVFLTCLPLVAQVPAATPPPKTPDAPTAAPATVATAAPVPPAKVDDTSVGFSYGLPSDWAFVAAPPAPKVVVPYPTLLAPKKGDACIDVVLTAKHGSAGSAPGSAPDSVVVVLDLPFSCYGQAMSSGDLVNFGAGAVEGMKQTFDLKTDAVEATYSLGDHNVWAERVDGTPKGHPENKYIFEIACTVLEKGAACWMTMASDWSDLKTFEQASVTLDGGTPAALVPEGAFPKKPPSNWYLSDHPAAAAH
jgi:hypothetical protein